MPFVLQTHLLKLHHIPFISSPHPTNQKHTVNHRVTHTTETDRSVDQMGKRKSSFLIVSLLVLVAITAPVVNAFEREEEEAGSGGGGREWREKHRREEEEEWPAPGSRGKDLFILQDSKEVVRTEAGSMRVVRGIGGRFVNSPMHIGFITMEPNSLFIPQYLDSSLIIFIRRGEAKIGSIYKDDLVERELKAGDVFTIQAGSAFYIVNTRQGQRLHAFCSIDTSESLNWHTFQSFYIAGGKYPASVLSGFDHQTLATAFNVSYEELGDILSRQQSGAIVYMKPEPHSPSVWSKFMDLKQHERLAHLRQVMPFEEEDDETDKEEEMTKWSFRKLLLSVFRKVDNRDDRRGKTGKSKDLFNLYDRSPDFKNDYGWSVAVDGSEYRPLKRSGMGIYLVNLTAGSMMAPHINPTATEYGIVLKGTGNVQIVYPNGSLAMNAEVHEGDVFWVPRYFPFCQVASRTGPFEFFGFTTSAHKNRPQFLVGQNSVLQSMRGPEFATAFGVSEDRLSKIIDAQREGIILPTPSAAPGGGEELPEDEDQPVERGLVKNVENFGFDLAMAGFD